MREKGDRQAHMQPFSKGGYIGDVSQTMTTVMLWASAHSPSRGVWGHAPSEMFGKYRLFEGDSEAF